MGLRVQNADFRRKPQIFADSPPSGTKKEPKPKLLSPDIFWWGGGLPREGVGAKKFGMSLETQGIKLFWRDIPGFCRDIPEAPEKFEKKMFGFNFWPLFSWKFKHLEEIFAGHCFTLGLALHCVLHIPACFARTKEYRSGTSLPMSRLAIAQLKQVGV